MIEFKRNTEEKSKEVEYKNNKGWKKYDKSSSSTYREK